MKTTYAGGALKLADGLTISRMGYGAMQLVGPNAFGQPKNRVEAIAVLKEAVALGIRHIDTADFYGPHVTNDLIKEALYPYPEGVHIATKVGTVRGGDGAWIPSLTRDDLVAQVHSNLEHLGLETLDMAYLRIGSFNAPNHDSLREPFTVLADLQRQGLIRHLGVSGVTPEQLSEAQSIAQVVAVQNFYNLANRQNDTLVDRCAREGIAFIPFFPLGGFRHLQSETLENIARQLEVSAQQVALAWLLQRSPFIALIPGTSSVAHMRENVAAVDLVLPDDAIEALDAIGAEGSR